MQNQPITSNILFIIKVKKDDDDNITHVMLQTGEQKRTKKEIIQAIKEGLIFYTYTSSGLGARVEVYTANNEEHIRTVNNGIKKDNLDNLPQF